MPPRWDSDRARIMRLGLDQCRCFASKRLVAARAAERAAFGAYCQTSASLCRNVRRRCFKGIAVVCLHWRASGPLMTTPHKRANKTMPIPTDS